MMCTFCCIAESAEARAKRMLAAAFISMIAAPYISIMMYWPQRPFLAIFFAIAFALMAVWAFSLAVRSWKLANECEEKANMFNKIMRR